MPVSMISMIVRRMAIELAPQDRSIDAMLPVVPGAAPARPKGAPATAVGRLRL